MYQHTTVLLNEAVDGLAIDPDGIYIDGTFGRGGHSRLILERLGANGRLIAIDRDPLAIEASKAIQDSRFTMIHSPFSQIQSVVESLNLVGQIDGILFDLGVSSPQLDDPDRGFSFMRSGPLDMRMDTSSGMTASEWLATTDEETMAWVFKTFGEERFAKKIARTIVEKRSEMALTTTLELAHLIANTVPFQDKHKHPATRVFQAIRIFINSELEEVEQALNHSVDLLKVGGRLSVISFHSLEDRLVKQFALRESKPAPLPKGLPLTDLQIKALDQSRLKIIGKYKPQPEEIAQNPRSRSALLRVVERV